VGNVQRGADSKSRPGGGHLVALLGTCDTRDNSDRELAKYSHIDKATVPFLIIHGDKDPIVPVDQSRDFHAALQKAGKDSTYIELPSEGHGFSQPGSLQKLLNSIRELFARHMNTGVHDSRYGR